MRRRTQAAIGTALVLFATTAAARVFVCMENGQKVFRSEACPNAEDALRSYTTPRIHLIYPGQAYSRVRSPDVPAPLEVAESDPRCKFSYYALSERGKALAEDAKGECLRNLALEKAGRSEERSLSAYAMWKDYWDSARATAPRTITCTNVGYGISTCR